MDEPEQLRTIAEVAQELRVGRETVYRSVRRGEIEVVRFGGRDPRSDDCPRTAQAAEGRVVKFGRRGTSYAGAAEPSSVDAERLADFRVRSARACKAWQELDPADLVARTRLPRLSLERRSLLRARRGRQPASEIT